ncbi:MAG: protein-export chaperone SecB [Gemmatimonadetes bacterium]|nr:protein-export chaperone SecB [Gemmatimonadota bacterium]
MALDRTKQPGIKIGQIFLEEAHFNHRADYLNLPPSTPVSVGDVHVQVQTGLSADLKRGLVRVRVSTIPGSKPMYELRVAMTALVTVDEAAPNMPLDRYLASSGAALLFPFVRELVANLTWRGRFGPLWLSPTNLLAPLAAAPPSARLAAAVGRKPQTARKRR